MTDGRRGQRVAEAVKNYLGTALLRDIGDPRLTSLVVTEVEVTSDLSLARARVRLLSDDDEVKRVETLRALDRVKGRLRRGLGPVLRLRRVPDLEFSWDVRPDATRRIDEVLAEIERDKG